MKKRILAAIVIVIIFVMVAGGCSANNKIQNKVNEQIRKNVVFDIPSLLDKDAGQIKKILGKPSFDGKHFGNSFKSLEWKKNNYNFSFDLNPDGSIRKKAFSLFGYVEKHLTKQAADAAVKSTLEAGNLDIKSKKYDLSLWSDGTAKRIIHISIHIKPRKKSHAKKTKNRCPGTLVSCNRKRNRAPGNI